MSKSKKNLLSIVGHIKQSIKRPSKGKSSKPKSVLVNRSITDRIRAHKDAKSRKRADYLATLPKNPIARFFYRLKPSVIARYWFSKQGLVRLLKLGAIFTVTVVLVLLGLFAYFRKDLPKNLADLKTCSNGASTTYFDRTGQTLLWSSSGDVECYPVKFDQLSPFIKNSVVASEDKDFYKHGAFSISGIARAGINNFKGGNTQGGSTITQQFVKNSLLTQDRTVGRKLKEIILATEVERSYSKDEILNAYLNEISFGSTYDGAEAASRGFFNKSARDLTLEQAALLTAVIPAPTYYSPYGQHTQALLERQHTVLDKMAEQGYITKQQSEDAKKVDVLAQLSTTGRDKYKNIKAPYFVLAVREQLESIYGANNINKYGYKIITTLDLRIQEVAEEVVADTIPKVVRNNGQNMAVVAEDVQTGQVLAEVGGRDFNYPGFGQLNMATTPREPGSTMKPYDYASLMTQSKNWGAGSTIFDTKTDFGAYVPNDFDKTFRGAMSIRKALGGSRNIPAIKAMYIAGIQNTFDLAKKMGLVSGSTCEPNCYLSSAIGGGSSIRLDEHVNAFSTFARMGKYKPQTYILKVEDSRGKVIKEWKDTPGEQVLDPQIAYTINDMLSDPKASYFGNNYRLNNGFKSSMKTGTTDKNENSWLMGYTPNIAFGIWTGRQNDINSMYVQGEVINGPAWNKFMSKAHEILGIKGSGWTKPSNMKTVCINQATGYATTSGGVCDIFPSWYNPRYPGDSKSATIDIISSKLATECTPETAKKTITSGGGILAELPTSDPMYRNWIKSIGGSAGGIIPTDKDDIHSCDQADKPTITLDVPTLNTDGTYTLTATATKSKYPLTTINFKIDGSTLPGGSFDITDTGTVTFKYTPAFTGPKDVVVEVIDNVLYTNSDTKSVNFAPAP